MKSYSIDKFYIVIIFILPTANDIDIKPINFDMNCNYLRITLDSKVLEIEHIPNIINFWSKIVPYVIH